VRGRNRGSIGNGRDRNGLAQKGVIKMLGYPRHAIVGSLVLIAFNLSTTICYVESRHLASGAPHLSQQDDEKGSGLGSDRESWTLKTKEDLLASEQIAQIPYPPGYYPPYNPYSPPAYRPQYQPPPQRASICTTSAGPCPLPVTIFVAVGSPCTCYSAYGTFFGVAR